MDDRYIDRSTNLLNFGIDQVRTIKHIINSQFYIIIPKNCLIEYTKY